MKVAIFGQYYQNDTRPIIRDIFLFFNNNNVELVIEEKFLKILYDEEILKKEYKTFNDYKCLNSSFDLLISIGGDGTILRAATYVRDSGKMCIRDSHYIITKIFWVKTFTVISQI